MIHLEPVTEKNWQEAVRLSVSKEQQAFLDSPVGIIARGYVYRDNNAKVLAIYSGSTLIGIAMVRNLDEDPACYDLQQLMIDKRFQRQGYGAQALRCILLALHQERAYDCVEVCVHQNNSPALRLFQSAGFQDTGYVDAAAPDCINLMYDFKNDEA